jgi:hypothetical protein
MDVAGFAGALSRVAGSFPAASSYGNAARVTAERYHVQRCAGEMLLLSGRCWREGKCGRGRGRERRGPSGGCSGRKRSLEEPRARRGRRFSDREGSGYGNVE